MIILKGNDIMLKIEKFKEEIEREKRHYFCNICGKELESKYDCGKKLL